MVAIYVNCNLSENFQALEHVLTHAREKLDVGDLLSTKGSKSARSRDCQMSQMRFNTSFQK